MINIVEDLEVISRLETEQSQLDIQPFDIFSLVEEVFEALEMKASQMNISLNIDNESQAKLVLGDRDKMQPFYESY